MRRRFLRTLPAPLCALLLASAAARAQEPVNEPATPPPAPSPAPQTEEPAAAPVSPAPSPAPQAEQPVHQPAKPPPAAPRAPKGRVPHPHDVRPVDAPTPSLEDIARAFDPAPHGLTAEEIVDKALQHSPELRKAELSVDNAEANKARAKIAFAPRIDLMGKFTHLSPLHIQRPDQPPPRNEIEGAVGNVLQNMFTQFQPIRDQWFTTAAVSLPVTDMFLTVIPTYKGAATLADVAESRRRASELQVSFDARMAFYGYAHVIGAVIVAQRAVQLYEANVRDLEELVKAGTATETDLMRARSALAKMKVQVVQFTGEQDVALARLAVITGTEMDTGRGIGERFVGIEMSPTPDVAKVASDAKRTRPEIVALRKLEEARKHFAAARRGAQLPQLKGFFNGYYSNALPRVIPPQDKWYSAWDVGVSLAYSPNDSIYAHTQYNDALAELESVRQDLRLVSDGIDMEVAHAVTTHRTAVANTKAATESLESARRYQADQRELMLAGAATPNDVLEAQVLLTRAALEWVDSFISVRMAEAALLKAQGKTGLSARNSAARSTP